MRRLGWLFALFALFAPFALTSCTVRATPPVAYVETTAAPMYLDAYPSTVYDGRVVYYVNDRLMYPDGGRWYSYRSEPAPLRQYRQRTYVRTAPPAPPRTYQPATPYSPPPGAMPPSSAPPAVRTQ